MSPEQVREQSLTHQTDIFSLGVLMYQLLTGRLPFQGANNYSMIYQIINVDPPQPSQLRSDLSPRIDAIVMRALKKDRSERYATWDEFAHDLVVARGGEDKHDKGFAESEKFDTLRKLDFFRQFSDVELWEVLRLATWHHHFSGTTLIQEGDIGSSFFILVSGQVKVVKQDRLLNLLKAGECFGEMAYLGKQKFPALGERHFHFGHHRDRDPRRDSDQGVGALPPSLPWRVPRAAGGSPVDGELAALPVAGRPQYQRLLKRIRGGATA